MINKIVIDWSIELKFLVYVLDTMDYNITKTRLFSLISLSRYKERKDFFKWSDNFNSHCIYTVCVDAHAVYINDQMVMAYDIIKDNLYNIDLIFSNSCFVLGFFRCERLSASGLGIVESSAHNVGGWGGLSTPLFECVCENFSLCVWKKTWAGLLAKLAPSFFAVLRFLSNLADSDEYSVILIHHTHCLSVP
jgi:hypothetical protein